MAPSAKYDQDATNHPHHGSRRLSSARTSPTSLLAEGHTVLGVDNLCTRLDHEPRSPQQRAALLARRAGHHQNPSTSVPSITSSTSPHPRARKTTTALASRPCSSAPPAPSTRLDLAKKVQRRLSPRVDLGVLRRPPKSIPQVETYWGNVNPVGPRSVYGRGQTIFPKPPSPPTSATTTSTPTWCASSTPMARACRPTTVA